MVHEQYCFNELFNFFFFLRAFLSFPLVSQSSISHVIVPATERLTTLNALPRSEDRVARD